MPRADRGGDTTLSITRSRSRLLAGVAAGVGARFGVNPWLVRIAWLCSVPFTVGLSAPLPLFYQNQGEIAKAEADHQAQTVAPPKTAPSAAALRW